ncbi:hypothetical protein TCAL_14568 [Tigriopus californicus]|uniref:ZP domain-containing protein n=1 Tax=Tigriopus californicus TaxID=6832 RepID=A0A553PAY1_TIGCA|nr:uncharacterized protein LOC131892754 [Tigriopus californicus]TRY74828.1 hypothetical protein TCAL_14568 [Tigriopus californicus]
MRAAFLLGLLLSVFVHGSHGQGKYHVIKEVIEVPDTDLATECQGRIQMINPNDQNLILNGPGNFTRIQSKFNVDVAFQVFGSCCWELCSRPFFRGKRTEILPGTMGQTDAIGSIRTIPCRALLDRQ